MGKRIPAAFLATLIALLLLAACGEDENGSANERGAEQGNGAATSNPPSGSADQESEPSEAEDSEPQEGETQTIAKAEFIRKANAICEATYKEVSAKALPMISKAAESERAAIEARLAERLMAPALTKEVEQLRALGTPPGDEEEVSAILEAIEEVIARIEADPSALVGNSRSFAKSADLARSYGLITCPYS